MEDNLEQAFKPVTVGKKSGSGLLRKQSLMTKSIEEKKQVLYNRQAGEYATWISEILGIPPFEGDLLPSLQSGVALCLLVNKIAPEKLKGLSFPTSLKNQNLFKAVENLNLFLKACDILGIKEEDLFQPSDILDGNNKLKVLRTLQCLRKLAEGKSGYEYDKFDKANFDLDFLEPKSDGTPAPTSGTTLKSRKSLRLKVDDAVIKRSFRLFSGRESMDISSGFTPHFQKDPAIDPDFEAELERESAELERSSSGNKIDQQLSTEDLGKVPFPSNEGVIEIPIIEDEHEDSHFIEPMDPDIMAHLLSKDDDYDDEDGKFDDSDGIDSHASEEELKFAEILDEHKKETEHIMESLKNEVKELQDLLKTEIVSHMKEIESQQEIINFLRQKLEDTEKRALDAERRARKAEEKREKLELMLEERDNSLSLLSQHYSEELSKSKEANERADKEALARAELEDKLKESQHGIESEASSEDLNQTKKKKKPKERRPTLNAMKRRPSIDIPTLAIQNELEKELGQKSSHESEKGEKKKEKKDKHEKEEKKKSRRKVRGESDSQKESDSIKDNASTAQSSIALLRSASFSTRRKNLPPLWAHLPEVKPLLANISEEEKAKQETIYELILTETAYINDLELIFQTFMLPMSHLVQENHLTQNEFNLIFRNIENIARVNAAFSGDLEKRQQEQWPQIKQIGDIFLKHVVYFDVYAEYCGDQKRATQTIKKLMVENEKFKTTLDTIHLNPDCRKLDIFAFFLIPMQRLTKYPLLLKNLLKSTSQDDADYDFLRAAVSELSRLIISVDEYAKRREELMRIHDIENQLNCSLIGNKQIILSDSDETGRYLVKEGNLTRLRLKNHSLTAEKLGARKTEQLYCFFFNDQFIFTKYVPGEGSNPPSYIVQVAPMSSDDYSVRNVPEATNGIGAKNVFLISSKETGTIVLQASTPQEKDNWISCFRKEEMIAESLLGVEDAESYHRKTLSKQQLEEFLDQTGSTRSLPRAFDDTSRYSQASIDSNKGSIAEDLTLSTSITIEQLLNPEFDGWLKMLVRGAFQTTSWKVRWCVIKDFCLYYFNDDHLDSKALGMIVLPSFQIVTAKSGQKKNIFKIQHPSSLIKPYVFAADTYEYFEVWIEALTHASLAKVSRRTFWL